MSAMRTRVVPVLLQLLFLAILGPLPPRASALDLQARVETRYQLQAGDGALDNDVFLYHFLELPFLQRFTFGWNGGLSKDLDGKTDSAPGATPEATDIALRGLPDAVNPDQTLEYRIYSAYLRFDLERFGVLAGRYNPRDYEFAQFDGLLLWATPIDRLRLEAFGGKPWHYGYLSDFSAYWRAGEVAAGAGADLSLLDDRLQLALRYQYLRELTHREALIGESSDTYLSSDHLSKLRVSLAPAPWLEAGVSTKFLGLEPRVLEAWASGYLEQWLASYSLGMATQFIDIAELSDRLTLYSALLGASHPYISVSAGLSKDFTDLLSLKGFFKALELELNYEHRQPLAQEDRSMFNPQYDQARLGLLVALRGNWSLLVDYNFVVSTGLENDLHAVGGELAKKWEKVDLRLGSSFYASRFQTDYTETVFSDSFFSQEYYLKARWRINRAFEVSLRGAIERARVTSLTSLTKVNELVVYEPMTELFSEPRNYYRLDVRAGYRY
jgi:hypothetical protein